MAGSYNSHAIVEPDKIIVTNPGGFIEVLGPDYRPDSELKLDAGDHGRGSHRNAAVL